MQSSLSQTDPSMTGKNGASPISAEEFELLKKTVLFTEEDERYLRLSGEVLRDQVDAILDVWYGFVGSNPHLLYYFQDRGSSKPDHHYLQRVRERFGHWILDTAAARYDQQWLDYQYEIGLRHHRTKKNLTDGVSTPEIVNLRYVLALLYPILATLKPFLAKKGHSVEEVSKMHDAWTKSVLLQVILWCQPYTRERDF
jgi:hypothetical protein